MAGEVNVETAPSLIKPVWYFSNNVVAPREDPKLMPTLTPTLTPTSMPTNIVRTNNFQLYGYSMSYNTLYFVGAMVVIGVIIYFVTNKKKSKKENDE